jgi:Tfp pilus assembly protein PilN
VRAVNLLPKDLAPERPSYKEALPIVGAAFVPLIAILLVFLGYNNARDDAAAQLGRMSALQLEIARAKPATAAKTVDTSELVSSRAARRTALQTALSKEIAWDSTLGDVARVLPATVWLSDLTAASPSPADSAAAAPAAPATGSTASGFTINGYTLTMDDVALLLQRLQLLPSLANVTLTSTSQTTIGVKPVVQFSINASIVTPATTAPPTTPPSTTTTGATP